MSLCSPVRLGTTCLFVAISFFETPLAAQLPPAAPITPTAAAPTTPTAPAAGAAPATPPTRPNEATDEVKVQQNKTNEAEDRVALAKSGRLLRYGITAGAGLAIQTPLESMDGVTVETAALTGLTYLGALPAYWTASEERATYCSTTGLLQDGEQAKRAATAVSRKTAKIRVEAMFSWLNSVFPGRGAVSADAIEKKLARNDNDEKRWPFERPEIVYLEVAASIREMPDGAQKDLAVQDLVNVIAGRTWRADAGAACGWYRVGLWLGRPFGYSTDITMDGKRETRDVNPIVSFGLLYVPNTYITAMAGVTYNTVLAPATEAGAASHHHVFTGTFGIGGTLDIAALLGGND